ncbi:MAG: MBL fold metallo-hydrolase [Bifidobacteriaceae bacterium]|nr:MBL fold metallo-hydrolase [Bifidobacteriaceae bacterium]
MRLRHYGQAAQLTLWAALFPVNCYLVREEDGLTLVDTTMRAGAKGVARAIQAAGIPLRRIVLTHVHADHIGGLDALKAVFPEAEVAVPGRSQPLLRGHMQSLPGEDPAPVKGTFCNVLTAPDRLVGPGDAVGSLEVVAAPGHTPDSVAYLDHRDGTLIAGDALFTRGGLAVAGERRAAWPFVTWRTWSAVTALRSARRLAGLEPSSLMCGHGPVLENPAAALGVGIKRAEARIGAAPTREPA